MQDLFGSSSTSEGREQDREERRDSFELRLDSISNDLPLPTTKRPRLEVPSSEPHPFSLDLNLHEPSNDLPTARRTSQTFPEFNVSNFLRSQNQEVQNPLQVLQNPLGQPQTSQSTQSRAPTPPNRPQTWNPNLQPSMRDPNFLQFLRSIQSPIVPATPNIPFGSSSYQPPITQNQVQQQSQELAQTMQQNINQSIMSRQTVDAILSSLRQNQTVPDFNLGQRKRNSITGVSGSTQAPSQQPSTSLSGNQSFGLTPPQPASMQSFPLQQAPRRPSTSQPQRIPQPLYSGGPENMPRTSFLDQIMQNTPTPSLGSSPPSSGLPSPTDDTPPGTSLESMFHLVHQPHEKQRKSYSRENRCLLPNPLVIKLKDQRDCKKIEKGGVYAKLVYENKEELEVSKRVLDGELMKPLDAECKAQFSLKVNDTSESRKYRILFTIKFIMNGVIYEELLFSSPFSVTSNKRRQFINPKLFDMKPREGLCSDEMEVWIKGRNFTERSSMVVKFGSKVANITETEDNLITCIVPPMAVTEDTPVEVTVSNIHPKKGLLSADTSLSYTYLSAVNPKKIKGNPSTQSTQTEGSGNQTTDSKSGNSQNEPPRPPLLPPSTNQMIHEFFMNAI